MRTAMKSLLAFRTRSHGTGRSDLRVISTLGALCIGIMGGNMSVYSAGALGAEHTQQVSAGEEPAPLAGPKVTEQRSKQQSESASGDKDGGAGKGMPGEMQTLILPRFAGGLQDLDGPPEEAALRSLSLSPAERDATEAVLLKRSRIFDRFVVGNINLLTYIGTVTQTGNVIDQVVAFLAAAQQIEDLWLQQPLRDQLEGVLTTENAATFSAMLDQYWDDVVDERLRASNGKEGWFAAISDAWGSTVGKEIERAYQRQEQSGGLAYAYITDGLKLTKPQQVRIRTLLADFAEKGGEEAPPEAKASVFFSLASMLTPEQARQVMRRFNPESVPENDN
ncbi:MAG: hypothetical protein SFZ23_11620 [Planctomycetota bacterium]|nr:hypothetical protein [Planctomycetota bacterium]